MTWEALKAPFPHGHSEQTVVHGTISSKRGNPETSLVTPTHQEKWENTHIDTDRKG